jgi:hypothetical protein
MTTGFVDRSAKKQPQPQPPTAGDLLLRIEAAKGQILVLQKQQYALVSAATYNDAANRQYTEILGQIAELERSITRDQLAITWQSHDAKVAAVSESATARRSKASMFEQHAQRSLDLVGEIAAGLEQATKAVESFYRSCNEMTAAAPAGINLPIDVFAFDFLINGTTIQLHLPMAISAEMHRLGASERLRLPGSRSPLVQTSGRPPAIPPMTQARAAVVDYLIAHMRKELQRMEAKETEQLA